MPPSVLVFNGFTCVAHWQRLIFCFKQILIAMHNAPFYGRADVRRPLIGCIARWRGRQVLGRGTPVWTCADLVIHLLELRAVSVGHPKHAKPFKKDLPACHPGPLDFKALGGHGAVWECTNVIYFAREKAILVLLCCFILAYVTLFMISTHNMIDSMHNRP